MTSISIGSDASPEGVLRDCCDWSLVSTGLCNTRKPKVSDSTGSVGELLSSVGGFSTRLLLEVLDSTARADELSTSAGGLSRPFLFDQNGDLMIRQVASFLLPSDLWHTGFVNKFGSQVR